EVQAALGLETQEKAFQGKGYYVEGPKKRAAHLLGDRILLIAESEALLQRFLLGKPPGKGTVWPRATLALADRRYQAAAGMSEAPFLRIFFNEFLKAWERGAGEKLPVSLTSVISNFAE